MTLALTPKVAIIIITYDRLPNRSSNTIHIIYEPSLAGSNTKLEGIWHQHSSMEILDFTYRYLIEANRILNIVLKEDKFLSYIWALYLDEIQKEI